MAQGNDFCVCGRCKHCGQYPAPSPWVPFVIPQTIPWTLTVPGDSTAPPWSPRPPIIYCGGSASPPLGTFTGTAVEMGSAGGQVTSGYLSRG